MTLPAGTPLEPDGERWTLAEIETKPGGLTAPVVRGGRWLFVSQVSLHALLLARQLFLMRMIQPLDFGLWAAVMTTVGLLKTFSDTTVGTVVIQRRDGGSPPVLMTVWWTTAFTGILLAAASLLGAPLISWYFGQPPLTGIFRVISIVFLLEYLVSPGLTIAQRELDFNRIAAVQLGSGCLSIVSTFVFAFVMPDVRCLVASELLVRAAAILLASASVLAVLKLFLAR